MKSRIWLGAVLLLGFAPLLRAQQNMFKIDLVGSGSMISLNEPILTDGKYVFNEWPEGGPTSLPQARVSKLTRLTGGAASTIYQLQLTPSGTVTAKDKPVLKGGSYQFHEWLSGDLMSVRQKDVQTITPMTGDRAFWVEQGLKGEKKIGGLSMEGTGKVVAIGTPPGGSSQAGRSNLSSVHPSGQGNPGISGAPAYGNWSYQGTPGVSDAWSPANATMSNGVPTMPAATDGGAPPTQQP